MLNIDNKYIQYHESIGDIHFIQLELLDQFGDYYRPLIDKYTTASSICGYISLSVVRYIDERNDMVQNFNDLLFELNDEKNVHVVEPVMQWLRNRRLNYVSENENEFKNEREKRGYLSDWVANFEISDYIKENFQGNDHIFFIRHLNEGMGIPLDLLKHEELKRLKEEEEFKGYEWIIETSSHRCVPQEFNRNFGSCNKDIFMTWIAGHYVVMIPMRLNNESHLVLFNSCKEKYIDQSIVRQLGNLYFKGKI